MIQHLLHFCKIFTIFQNSYIVGSDNFFLFFMFLWIDCSLELKLVKNTEVACNLPAMRETGLILELGRHLEKGKVTHSSILVWRIPWTVYSLWGHKELDTTERLHFHFSLSCIGEGNGNPLQCSCLENPRDRGAWWAAVYGITQSQTQPKWLSSSSLELA